MSKKSKHTHIEFGDDGPGASEIVDTIEEPKKKPARSRSVQLPVEMTPGTPVEDDGSIWGRAVRGGQVKWIYAGSPFSTTGTWMGAPPGISPAPNLSTPNAVAPSYDSSFPDTIMGFPVQRRGVQSFMGIPIKSVSYMQELAGTMRIVYDLIDGRRITVVRDSDGREAIEEVTATYSDVDFSALTGG